MNEAIEALVLSICALALRINAAGQYHAHYYMVAHCDHIQVTVYPADHQYTGIGSADPLFRSQAEYRPQEHWADLGWTAERCVKELEALQASLLVYLPEGLEVAA